MRARAQSTEEVGRYRWQVRPGRRAEARELSRVLGVSPLTAQLLLNRGLEDDAAAREFLAPRLTSLPDPSGLPDVDVAVERLVRAVRERELILLHGDYDVDGLSGTAVLETLFRQLGAPVEVFIPNRLIDGYGMRVERIDEFAAKGVRVIVTVDTGTSAHAPIARAREHGIDVIVTDHHEPPEHLPEGAWILNPKRADSTFGTRTLAGSGVAFMLAWALARHLCGGERVTERLREFLMDALALVALGTVADVVPLVGANRVLVREGLRRLGATSSPGLRALQEVALRGGKRAGVREVGFQLAPRLNAAGRLGRGELAFELLITDSTERARELALELDRDNQRRRQIESDILQQVLDHIERHVDLETARTIVLGDEGWHLGVLGIVAARLVDRLARPVLLIAFEEDGRGRASARGVPGFELHLALSACSEHLVAHGGHAQAAGFEIERSRLEQFQAAMEAYAREASDEEIGRASLDIDCEVELEELAEPVVLELARMEPFGAGNPEPLLACRGIAVAGVPRRVGAQGDHLKFIARQGATTVSAIAFGCGHLQERLSRGVFDAAFTPSMNEFNGRREIQMDIRDLSLPDDASRQR